jgi:hypothetical protein
LVSISRRANLHIFAIGIDTDAYFSEIEREKFFIFDNSADSLQFHYQYDTRGNSSIV